MNESNLFQEIEEDLQRKNLEAWWKKYGHYVIGAALAVVVATAASVGWQSHNVKKEQQATSAIVTVLDDKAVDPAKKLEQLQAFSEQKPKIPLAAIARFHAAGELLKKNQPDKALEIYNTIATDASVEKPFRQLADLYAVQIQMDTGEPEVLMARLEPLMGEDSAWKPSAKEFAAFLALRASDKDKAKKLFTELGQEPDVPTSIVQRAGDMRRWIEEEVKDNDKK